MVIVPFNTLKVTRGEKELCALDSRSFGTARVTLKPPIEIDGLSYDQLLAEILRKNGSACQARITLTNTDNEIYHPKRISPGVAQVDPGIAFIISPNRNAMEGNNESIRELSVLKVRFSN